MSDDAKKPKAVRPIFLIAMGIALAGFGLISGMALDVATRPPERRPSFTPKPKPQQPQPQSLAPLIEEVTNIRPERPSGEPIRAWAPDAPAGDRPMVAFAARPQATAGQPVIAIVIDDMGVDRARSLRMVELQGPLTLSVMTMPRVLPISRAGRAARVMR